MRVRSLALGLCGLLVVAATAFAQERTGGIAGTMKDSSGAILPGATVQATSPSLVGAQTAVADHQGAYRFPALTPGVYEITATLQGFTAQGHRRAAGDRPGAEDRSRARGRDADRKRAR